VHFFAADSLSGKDGAEINLFLAQTDAAAMRNHNRSVAERIVDVGQALVERGDGR
jgi:hypothetical protein